MLDAPTPLFWGEEDIEGEISSRLNLAIGPMTLEADFEEAPYDEGDEAGFDMALSFDGISVDHAAFVPDGLGDYPDGRDVFPDDLEAYLRYAVVNAAGRFDMRESYGYGNVESRAVADASLAPSNLNGRIEIDPDGLFTVEALLSTSFAVMFEERSVREVSSSVMSFDTTVQGMGYGLTMAVPMDNAMMNFMQGLPEGVEYRVTMGVAEAALEFLDEYTSDDYGTDRMYFDGDAAGFQADVGFTDQDLNVMFSAGRLAGRFQENEMPGPFGAEILDVLVAQNMPLNTGTGSRPYDLTLRLGSLVLDDAIWDMVFPGQALDRSPMSLSARIDGQMRASTNPMAFAMFGMGMSPFVAETMVIEAGAAALGATIDVVGNFDTERVISESRAPVGIADFTSTGLDDVLSALAGLGLFSEEELIEAAFFLNAFTEQQPDGERTMRVEINDQDHVIVNGVRLQ
jgi:hypothetical protein